MPKRAFDSGVDRTAAPEIRSPAGATTRRMRIAAPSSPVPPTAMRARREVAKNARPAGASA